MRNTGIDLGGVVSCWHRRVYLRFLLFDIALLDVLCRAFVRYGECRLMISGLLELSSLSFCRNSHPSFFTFHFSLVAGDKCHDNTDHFNYVGSGVTNSYLLDRRFRH
ncbi:hypothetical protein F2Q68_00038611 [Brassica cretica]|uniref:Uncharacterized protein n=2 Tax=Brassica cretica TaxID=69181 RepID=A0A8S9MLF5_BRACR|nr:hypothetical protein F2Q68_00038611 [Brassica cretica]KAF3494121.1 hypothetical protein DY000_02052177 [Brassica cretica]